MTKHKRTIAYLVIVVAAILAVRTAEAHATTLVMHKSPETGYEVRDLYQSWADESLMPTAPMKLQVIPACMPSEVGSTCFMMEPLDPEPGLLEGTSIRLWFDDMSYLTREPGREADLARIRMVFLHEMGHVLDWHERNMKMHKKFRKQFKKIMGYKGHWTRTTIVERFGDAYALCAASPELRALANYEGYGIYKPTAKQHAKVCNLISNMAG